MNALTEVEQERFSLIESLMDGQYVDARPALMRVLVDGQERAALVAVVTQPSGDFLVARWDERGVQLHTAVAYAESDVIAAFGGADRAGAGK